MLYLWRKLTTYVYAVGKQPSSNVWYKMVKDGIGELWMKGWNLLHRLFRFIMRLCLIMLLCFIDNVLFYATIIICFICAPF